jgi:V/A-type H+-transporting ATPase subunit K
MMTTTMCRAPGLFAVLVVVAVFAAPQTCWAAADPEEAAVETGAGGDTVASAIRIGGLGLAAALAIGLACLATARVQAAVGAGGTGALAEKPELFTNILILYAVPETLVILGFVVAVLLVRLI